jgi:hypothetical protein
LEQVVVKVVIKGEQEAHEEVLQVDLLHVQQGDLAEKTIDGPTHLIGTSYADLRVAYPFSLGELAGSLSQGIFTSKLTLRSQSILVPNIRILAVGT